MVKTRPAMAGRGVGHRRKKTSILEEPRLARVDSQQGRGTLSPTSPRTELGNYPNGLGNDSSRNFLIRAQPGWHLDFALVKPRTEKRGEPEHLTCALLNFFPFKLPSLWQFVTVAIGKLTHSPNMDSFCSVFWTDLHDLWSPCRHAPSVVSPGSVSLCPGSKGEAGEPKLRRPFEVVCIK